MKNESDMLNMDRKLLFYIGFVDKKGIFSLKTKNVHHLSTINFQTIKKFTQTQTLNDSQALINNPIQLSSNL